MHPKPSTQEGKYERIEGRLEALLLKILGQGQINLRFGGGEGIVVYMYYSLNSLKGGYIGDYIGDYYRGY